VIIPVFWSGRLNLRPRCAEVVGACDGGVSFGTKSFLLLLILLVAVVEFTAEPYVFPSGKPHSLVESVSPLDFLDRVPIRAVVVPGFDQGRVAVRGSSKAGVARTLVVSGCLLLGWVGTELACPEGTAYCSVTETDVCWFGPVPSGPG